MVMRLCDLLARCMRPLHAIQRPPIGHTAAGLLSGSAILPCCPADRLRNLSALLAERAPADRDRRGTSAGGRECALNSLAAFGRCLLALVAWPCF